MALTLVEASKLSNDSLLAGVIETIALESPILQRLPFVEIVGNGLTYNRENAAPSAEFYDVGDDWDEIQEGERTALDNTAMLYLSSMMTGSHNNDQLPVVMVGLREGRANSSAWRRNAQTNTSNATVRSRSANEGNRTDEANRSGSAHAKPDSTEGGPKTALADFAQPTTASMTPIAVHERPRTAILESAVQTAVNAHTAQTNTKSNRHRARTPGGATSPVHCKRKRTSPARSRTTGPRPGPKDAAIPSSTSKDGWKCPRR